MKKFVLKGIAILFVVGFIACKKNEKEEKDPEPEEQLVVDDTFKGTWKTSDGNQVFTGAASSFTFQEVKTGKFLESLQKGLIKLGDPYIRNIVKQGTTWKCDVLFWGLPPAGLTVKWSTTGTLSLSQDKKTLTISATSPFDSTPATGTLYRQ